MRKILTISLTILASMMVLPPLASADRSSTYMHAYYCKLGLQGNDSHNIPWDYDIGAYNAYHNSRFIDWGTAWHPSNDPNKVDQYFEVAEVGNPLHVWSVLGWCSGDDWGYNDGAPGV